MVANKAMHDFAVKYHNLYTNPQTTERDVESTFANECFALGFKMDCGERFNNAFPDVGLGDAEGLDKINDDISDAQLLGFAIFSEWRYITHWSMGGEDENLLSLKHRKWFILAFAKIGNNDGRQNGKPICF